MKIRLRAGRRLTKHACAMRLASLVPLLVVLGCGPGTAATQDLSATAPGCRAPSKCYKVSCPCTRALLDTEACVACNPLDEADRSCDCPEGSRCLDPSEVCIGRAATACTLPSARCLPAGSDCATMSGGVPPMMVAVTTSVGDASVPATEPRCPFSGDVCCAGEAPAADMSVPVDLATRD